MNIDDLSNVSKVSGGLDETTVKFCSHILH